jgi:hypothetical protein
MAIGADCSMRLGSAGYTLQQRVQFDESAQVVNVGQTNNLNRLRE